MMPKVNESDSDGNLENSELNQSKRLRHQNYSKNIYIGTRNAEKWEKIRNQLQYKNDVEFVSFLLSLAEGEKVNAAQRFNADENEDLSVASYHQDVIENEVALPPTVEETLEKIPALQKKIKKVQFKENINIINSADEKFALPPINVRDNPQQEAQQDHSISSTIDGSMSDESSTTEVLDYRIAEKIKNELEEKQKLVKDHKLELPVSISISSSNAIILAERQQAFEHLNKLNLKAQVKLTPLIADDTSRPETKCLLPVPDKIEDTPQMPNKLNDANLLNNPIDNDPEIENENEHELEVEHENENENEGNELIIDTNKKSSKRSSKKKIICYGCNSKHGKEPCPLINPKLKIANMVEYDEWLEKHNKLIKEHLKMPGDVQLNDNEDGLFPGDDEDEAPENESLYKEKMKFLKSLPTFSEASLPNEFDLTACSSDADAADSLSVFAQIIIPKLTQLGPLRGNVIQEIDVPDDCNMHHIYEMHDGKESKFIDTENKNQSNWLRYVKPAKTREARNLALVSRDNEIYFVTISDVEMGCELLYWSDDINSAWNKKKIEKNNCGGCNIKFDHPLYYRSHCSIFHDSAFSLTIRKYHCKICGIAVLGKENIMKHAEKLHEGKGAYQCQFCKKFFLRLNYLEMHRTYGCSANPQRARPLCDFCGRKFCQPQKLKVHIKRMHSDMADVLRDFQCKLCSKLLGSRAALQRHSKEVHSRNSAVVSCPRCQKLFQNRSNLKIHMLTHSGVRPFKCIEGDCAAAFTTKQCLQFHYKKVHSYTQEQMPKIERSVAYTFDAYSGGLKGDALVEGIVRKQRRKLSETPSEPGEVKPVKQPKRRTKAGPLKNKNFLSSINDLCKNENSLNLISSKIACILNSNNNSNNSTNNNNSNSASLNEPNAKEAEDLENEKYENEFEHDDEENIEDDEVDDEDDDVDEDDFDNDNIVYNDDDDNTISSLKECNNPNLLDNFDNDKDVNDQLNIADEHNEQEGSSSCSNNNPGKVRGKIGDMDDFDMHSSNSRYKDFLMASSNQNLMVSKGSKKWISEEDTNNIDNEIRHESVLAVNRDLLAKLILNNTAHSDQTELNDHQPLSHHLQAHHHHHHPHHHHQQQQQQQQQQQEQHQHDGDDEEDEADDDDNSTILDVVDSNHPHLNRQTSYSNNFANMAENQTFATTNFSHPPFLGNYYNGSNDGLNNGHSNANGRGTQITSSASMLVEAALNSVSNIINSEDLDGQNSNLNSDNFNSGNSMMNAADSDSIKMLKAHNYQMQLQSAFPNQRSSLDVSQTLLHDDNKIDVEASTNASTPKSQHKASMVAYGEDEIMSYQAHHNQHNSQSPSPISPAEHEYNSSNHYDNSRHHIENSPISNAGMNGQSYIEHDIISPASTPSSLPRYDFNNDGYRRRDKGLQHLSANIVGHSQNMHSLSSDEDSSIVIAENLSMNHDDVKHKLNNNMDLLYASKFDSSGVNKLDIIESRLKFGGGSSAGGAGGSGSGGGGGNVDHEMDLQDFRNNGANNETQDYHGLDMSSRSNIGGYSNLMGSSAPGGGFNRYHHHIYDILTDRDQQQTQLSNQLSSGGGGGGGVQSSYQQIQQQIPHILQDHVAQQEQHEHDQSSSVDLSRTSNYLVASSPSPYIHSHAHSHSHSHSEMLRMVSLDLSSGNHGNNMISSSSHHSRHSSFISSQLQHGGGRNSESSIPDHHRLLASEQLSQNHRLLVDPAAQLLLEQNNRLLNNENNRLLGPAESANGRHVVSPPRGFGAYHHQHHQVPSSNYHHHHHHHAAAAAAAVKQSLDSPNQYSSSTNYHHPFPAYY